MGMMKGVLLAGAYGLGAAATICKGAGTVMGVGHLMATGLRKTADGVDYVTDKAQSGAHTCEDWCNAKSVEYSLGAELSDDSVEAAAEFTDQMVKDMKESMINVTEEVNAAMQHPSEA